LGMTLTRSGNMSAYGDIKVDHISADGKISKVDQANGVAVYTPNQRRRFEMALRNPGKVDLTKGKLHIQFLTQSDLNPGKLAEAEINLNR
jgi:hypothetical protein